MGRVKIKINNSKNIRRHHMDIFKFAIQMEQDGEQYYRQLAARTAHPGIQGVFNQLADDEVKHAQAIQHIQQEAGPFVETTVLENAKNVFQQIKDFGGDFDISGDEESAYRQAMELEQKSISFYLDRFDQVEDPGQKGLFEKLAEEEKKHYHLISNLIDFVASPKTWLEDARFTHLDEY
jgi:rubrerythrin